MKFDMPEEAMKLLMGNFTDFNPVQKAALEEGVLEGNNLVVAAPTASGKTLIAEMAILRNFYKEGKTIYLCPLRALAYEKYEDFQKYKQLGMKIVISTGDFDKVEKFTGYDLIILSNEKADSLLRHNALPNISLIIADEVHLINDVGRGPTLEVVLTRLMESKPHILALSATISNAKEIAEWLNAKLVKSDYRPIKLEKGTLYPDGDSHTLDLENEKEEIDDSRDSDLVFVNNVLGEKQALIFVSTRRSAEATAEKIKFVNNNELNKIATEVESALSVPTKQCKRLAGCVRQGTAFHHAGLMAKQRKLIENAFKDRKIKILTATPSLAMGINLPAHTVLIRDTKRYDSEYGSGYLPVLEVQQMMGRAGRPKYDKEGRAIIIGKTKKEAKELKEMYIDGEPEPIYSKLSVEPVLRMHTLALIASETTKTKNELRDFFSRTFFAHQYKKIDEVIKRVEKILKELESFKFIKIGSKDTDFITSDFIPAFDIDKDVQLKATLLGKKVSDLYIDPLSAAFIINNISASSSLEQLMIIVRCNEIHTLNVRKTETGEIEDSLTKSGITTPDVWDVDYYDFLCAFKTALVFQDWIDEKTEDYILDKYGVAPGELYNKITSGEWLLYAGRELALILRKKDEANNWNKTRLRVKEGVREELLKLTVLKGIGRARARKLYNAGIKTYSDIKTAGLPEIGKIVGPKVAKQILEEAENRRIIKIRQNT